MIAGRSRSPRVPPAPPFFTPVSALLAIHPGPFERCETARATFRAARSPQVTDATATGAWRLTCGFIAFAGANAGHPPTRFKVFTRGADDLIGRRVLAGPQCRIG